MKILVVLFFLFSSLLADDYYLYKLYNNKCEAIFPTQPKEKTSRGGSKFYTSKDRKRQITYVAMRVYLPMSYTQALKQFGKNHIDNAVKSSITSARFNILEFNSTANKHQYKAIYKAEDIRSSTVKYGVIIQKGKNDYRWNIWADNINYRDYAEEIRDGYKSYFKVSQ